jgi:hypothetical protein
MYVVFLGGGYGDREKGSTARRRKGRKENSKLTTVTQPMPSSTLIGTLSVPQLLVSYVQKKRFRTMTPLAVLPYMMSDAPPGTNAGPDI